MPRIARRLDALLLSDDALMLDRARGIACVTGRSRPLSPSSPDDAAVPADCADGTRSFYPTTAPEPARGNGQLEVGGAPEGAGLIAAVFMGCRGYTGEPGRGPAVRRRAARG